MLPSYGKNFNVRHWLIERTRDRQMGLMRTQQILQNLNEMSTYMKVVRGEAQTDIPYFSVYKMGFFSL